MAGEGIPMLEAPKITEGELTFIDVHCNSKALALSL
jgi:hypothetical protein